MTTVLIIAIIAAATIYVIGALIWACYWFLEWDTYNQTDRTEAARNILITPLWPLPALQIAAQTIADLRNDAKETP